eukprot:scaffold41218_cov58-Phaeocystis_antarctica.AAC.2
MARSAATVAGPMEESAPPANGEPSNTSTCNQVAPAAAASRAAEPSAVASAESSEGNTSAARSDGKRGGAPAGRCARATARAEVAAPRPRRCERGASCAATEL